MYNIFLRNSELALKIRYFLTITTQAEQQIYIILRPLSKSTYFTFLA